MDDFEEMPKMAGWHEAKVRVETFPSMVPTHRLRFVERETKDPNNFKTVRILQQWWAPFRTFSDGYGYQTVELKGGEWRDVQVEEENP
jgi:hypothetical protein